MSDALVSIRLPKGLMQELKALVPKRHYLDLSEEVRSIVRQKAIHYLNATEQAKNAQVQDHAQQKKKEEIVAALRELLEVGR